MYQSMEISMKSNNERLKRKLLREYIIEKLETSVFDNIFLSIIGTIPLIMADAIANMYHCIDIFYFMTR